MNKVIVLTAALLLTACGTDNSETNEGQGSTVVLDTITIAADTTTSN